MVPAMQGLVAPAGSQAAPLHPDESISHWRFSLATGVAMVAPIGTPLPRPLARWASQR